MNRNILMIAVPAICIFGLVLFAYIHGADLRILNPQGPVGLQERFVIDITLLLCAFIVIPVFIFLFSFAWKYRASNEDIHKEHAPDWDHDSWTAELSWWLGPTLIILFLAVIAWQSSHALDPFKPLQSKNPTLTVQVVALDWKWLFIYPDYGIASVNMIEFPANTPVHFYITSDAPMNSFWIPSLGGQIMAMPGMTTQLNLLANTSGTFNGFSSNISGDGFAGMTFNAKSVSETDFEAWVKSVQGMSHPLNAATYATLATPSSYVPVSFYSSVDPELYTTSVMKYMMSMPVEHRASSPVPVASSSATTSMPERQMMPGMLMTQ